MADQHGHNNPAASSDPLAHERGINPKLPHNEDPIGEFRNEGHEEDKGWHQGGDWGGGHAANVGESAGELADDEKAAINKAESSKIKSHEPGSQTADKHEAPGSNTASTSTGATK